VPLYHLMEDAATAEICRTQLWQWIHHGAQLDDGRTVTQEVVEYVIHDEMRQMMTDVDAEHFAVGRFAEARVLFERVACSERLEEFLTIPAYGILERRTT